MAIAYRILLLAVAILFTDCKKEERESKAPTAGQWHSVMNTEGIGEGKTELFTVEGGQWRVRWQTLPVKEGKEGYINLWIYSEEELFVDRPVSSDGIGYTEGETLVNGSGAFYINVGSERLTWKITVEEFLEESPASDFPKIALAGRGTQ